MSMAYVHTRSQLRHSRFDLIQTEGQNRYRKKYRTRVVREIRSLRGNMNNAKYHIRPSSQGSWGCPKACLAQDYGKFSDKD